MPGGTASPMAMGPPVSCGKASAPGTSIPPSATAATAAAADAATAAAASAAGIAAAAAGTVAAAAGSALWPRLTLTSMVRGCRWAGLGAAGRRTIVCWRPVHSSP